MTTDMRKAAPMPPASNTGAQHTDDALKIDWVSFTLPVDRWPEFLRVYPWDVTLLDRGGMGYTASGIILDVGRVFWSPLDSRMGYHVSLPATALAMPQVGAPLGLLACVFELGGHLTRLDLARDSAELDLSLILAKLQGGEYLSRWKSFTAIQKTQKTLDGMQVGGMTIYLGNRQSRMYARFYDKQAERIQAGEPDPGPLTRFEMECKREGADVLGRALVAGDWETVLGVFASYLSFREPQEGDSNPSRWPVSAWWESFLEGVAAVRGLFAGAAAKTLGDVAAWVKKQVAPALAMLLKYADGDLGIFADMAKDGRSRWKGKHRAMVAAAMAA